MRAHRTFAVRVVALMGLGLVLGVSRAAAQPAVEARLDYTAESVAVLAGAWSAARCCSTTWTRP